MDSRMVMLFPGQGAYLPGAFSALVSTYSDVTNLLQAVDQVAVENRRAPISTLLLDTDAPSLEQLVQNDPARAHLAIYVTSLAIHRVMTEVHEISPDLLAGHSFGEIAALTAAGAFDAYDGATIVAARDGALEQCVPPKGGLLSLRAGAARSECVVGAAGTWHTSVAAVNSPTQTVVSGPEAELEHIEAVARVAGIETTRLRVPYPFHNRLLHSAADSFAERLSNIPVKGMRMRVYSPIQGRYYDDDDDLRGLLAGQLVRPVGFADAVRTLFGQGVGVYVEAGAGSILTDLVKGNIPDGRTHAPLRTRCGANELSERIGEINGKVAPASAVPAVQAASVPQAVVLPPRSKHGDGLVEMLRREYASGLDYPLDVLTPDADLEADLGVDSIKQTEMFRRVREQLGLPQAEGLRITSFRTLADVAALLAKLGAVEPVREPS